MLVLTFAFTLLYLPETHGRTVEEIQRLVKPDEEVRVGVGLVEQTRYGLYEEVSCCTNKSV